MKKVLIISWFFPPVGGVGSLRPLKFVKYLREFGWEPIVLTCDGDRQDYVQDASLLDEIPDGVRVERVPCRTYTRLWARLARLHLYRATAPIRNRVEFPDRWAPWIRPAARRAIELAKEADAVFSTSAPYSCHLIAQRVKAATGLPWLADFRDEWSRNPGLVFRSQRHVEQVRRLEKTVLDAADTVVSVTNTCTAQFADLSGGPDENVVTITNGFDPADFEEPVARTDDPRFSLVYAGSIYSVQMPHALVRALRELADADTITPDDFVLRIAGQYPPALFAGLEPFIDARGFLPHRDAVRLCREADALALFITPERGPSACTGKVFEYLAARRPILALVPETGEAARIVREVGAGDVVPAHDVEACKAALRRLVLTKREQGVLEAVGDREQIEAYSRRFLTQALAAELDRMTGGNTPRLARPVRHVAAAACSESANLGFYAAHTEELRDRWSDFDVDSQQARQLAERAMIHCLRALGVTSPAELRRQRIVDVGCGDGRWLGYLERSGADPAKLAGTDLSPERVARARECCRTTNLTVSSAFRLPYDDDAFDIALLILVMHNVEEDDLRAQLASELVRIVRPGGAVIYNDGSGAWRAPHFRPTTKDELARWFAPLQLVARRGSYLHPRIRRGRRLLLPLAERLQWGFQNYCCAIRIDQEVKKRHGAPEDLA